jgi:hypothetical protein
MMDVLLVGRGRKITLFTTINSWKLKMAKKNIKNYTNFNFCWIIFILVGFEMSSCCLCAILYTNYLD